MNRFFLLSVCLVCGLGLSGCIGLDTNQNFDPMGNGDKNLLGGPTSTSGPSSTTSGDDTTTNSGDDSTANSGDGTPTTTTTPGSGDGTTGSGDGTTGGDPGTSGGSGDGTTGSGDGTNGGSGDGTTGGDPGTSGGSGDGTTGSGDGTNGGSGDSTTSEGIACRMTGGGNGTFSDSRGTNVFTYGGQNGAPTASDPQPRGEWTHHQQSGPDGSFVFHAGTSSSPVGTEVTKITCSDPGWCKQARPAPAKQLDLYGIGSFRNTKDLSPTLAASVNDSSLHFYRVHYEDLGETDRSTEDPVADGCPVAGSQGLIASCGCPDFYRITIHATTSSSSPVIYQVYTYLTGGNFQIHPAIK